MDSVKMFYEDKVRTCYAFFCENCGRKEYALKTRSVPYHER